MFVRVHKPLAVTGGNNKGSSHTLFDYLSKEDIGKEITDKGHFFSLDQDALTQDSAREMIDNNTKNLGKEDYKFYMVTINPSQQELAHLTGGKTVDAMSAQEKRGFEHKLKAYTHEVMNQYAGSFNKGLDNTDLVYAAKIEHTRTYKGYEPEVKAGLKKSGQEKEGLQSHVHVVVSRNNNEQTMKLSPLSKHRPDKDNTTIKGLSARQGFEHVRFKENSQQAFDSLFHYQRAEHEKAKLPNPAKSLDAQALSGVADSPGLDKVQRFIDKPSGQEKFKMEVLNIKDRHLDPFQYMNNQLEKDLGNIL